MSNKPTAIVLMGVSGSGKTTVGGRLSRVLGWSFFDGDDFHSQENLEKMAAGIPLSDEDRTPWLATLHNLLAENLGAGKSIVLACSALKQRYRDQIVEGIPNIFIVYLKGDLESIYERMQTRTGHYMKSAMLKSQFEALEEPAGGLIIDIDQSLGVIVDEIISELQLL